jgi:hypothetical protein
LGTPSVNLTTIPSSADLNLFAIAFCNNPSCTSFTPTVNANWGAAFYKDIKVWSNKTTNAYVIQEYYNGYFKQTLKDLLIEFPLNIQNSDIRVIKNTIDSSKNINLDDSLPNNSYLINTDSDYLLNFSTKFDYSENSPNNALLSLNSSGVTTKTACNTACSRCWDNSSTNCYKCNVGYKPYDKNCLKTDYLNK